MRELLEEPKKKKKPRTTKRAGARAKDVDDTLDRVLSRVSAEPAPAEKRVLESGTAPAIPALRTARLVTLAGAAAEIMWRGERAPVVAAVSDDVEPDVLRRAAENRDSVLVECSLDGPPIIVGVVQTRTPRKISLKGVTVEIEAEREILLKTGRGALRIREDGDIELVGSRIHAMSRGLFRIVGKMLRLN